VTKYDEVFSGYQLHQIPDDDDREGPQNISYIQIPDTAYCPRRPY